MPEAAFAALKQRIVASWTDVQNIAASVPPASELIRFLEQAGALTSPEELGLGAEDVSQALQNAHYLRRRLSILKRSTLLGIHMLASGACALVTTLGLGTLV